MKSLLLLLVAFTVGAAPATSRRVGVTIQKMDAEARSYLPQCKEQDPERQQLCLLTERNFIEQYVYAMAGDVLAMGSTAFSFDENAESEEFKRGEAYNNGAGRPFNAVLACAWRMVIADQPRPPHGPADVELAATTCGRLTLAGHADAAAQARAIVHAISIHATPRPADDWEPKMAGLRVP